MRRVLLVYVGGGAGAVLRALLLGLMAPWDRLLPLSVLVVNVLGTFALGVVFALADEAGLLGAETRLALAVGVLGGFTTFSTFAWGADVLIAHHEAISAVAYVGASVLGGFATVGLGLAASRELVGVLPRLDRRGQSERRVDSHGDVESIEARERHDARAGDSVSAVERGRRR